MDSKEGKQGREREKGKMETVGWTDGVAGVEWRGEEGREITVPDTTQHMRWDGWKKGGTGKEDDLEAEVLT